MTYCQDCGAAADLIQPICHICGSTLRIDRGTTPCDSCHELVGNGASFCSMCGSPIGMSYADGPPLASVGAPRSLSGEPAVVAAASSAVAAPARVTMAERLAAVGGRSPDGSEPRQSADAVQVVDLGAGLDLPDWLKRAAADTPQMSTRRVSHGDGPEQGYVSAVVDNPSERASSHQSSLEMAPRVNVRRSTLTPSGRTVPSPEPSSFATDASFISEQDLPEWLRQAVAVEEAKAERERRQAVEAQARADAEVIAKQEATEAANRRVAEGGVRHAPTIMAGPVAELSHSDDDQPVDDEHDTGNAPWLDRRRSQVTLPPSTFTAPPVSTPGKNLLGDTRTASASPQPLTAPIVSGTPTIPVVRPKRAANSLRDPRREAVLQKALLGIIVALVVINVYVAAVLAGML